MSYTDRLAKAMSETKEQIAARILRAKPAYLTHKQDNGLFRLERHEFLTGGKVIATDLTLDEVEALLKVKGEE